ncbi:hypothetical protein, partial [Methanogenium sp. MK-MG]|uniref:hypothetical protein n=1 Tax=Methanogenium sp. MK-MG TaxID=2599926 RepID=UPI001C20299A
RRNGYSVSFLLPVVALFFRLYTGKSKVGRRMCCFLYAFGCLLCRKNINGHIHPPDQPEKW